MNQVHPSIDAALEQWRQAVGDDAVITEPAQLEAFSTATFSSANSIPACLRPRNVQQVQDCLQIATRFQIPIYPVSTGKNWGYGSKVPVEDQCILMDLSLLRQILDFNEKLGYVTVEPGVTQAQLFAFLREKGSGLWMDATGSSPHCSIIGNTLERGFGHTPYGDHFAQMCGLEVALPNGDLLQTGFPASSGIHAAPVYRYGLGPGLEGLFAQSNLGVVTKMTLWLMPAPEYMEAFLFSCSEESDLGPVLEALRPLRMNGTLRSAVHIGNDYKVLAGIQQYPWDETGGATPLQPEVMRRMRRKLGLGAWNGSGALYGTRAQVAEGRRILRLALRGKVAKLHFLNERLLNAAERYSSLFHVMTRIDVRRTISLVRPLFGLLRGVPTAQSLTSAYWRKRRPIPATADPDGHLCGLQWFSPVAPIEDKHAERIVAIASRIMLANGFEPALSFTLLTERAMICVISLTYDREVSGEDGRATACYQELTANLVAQGYLPYRLGIQSMDLIDFNGPAATVIAGLKRQLDPAGILAPGRYEPPPEH